MDIKVEENNPMSSSKNNDIQPNNPTGRHIKSDTSFIERGDEIVMNEDFSKSSRESNDHSRSKLNLSLVQRDLENDSKIRKVTDDLVPSKYQARIQGNQNTKLDFFQKLMILFSIIIILILIIQNLAISSIMPEHMLNPTVPKYLKFKDDEVIKIDVDGIQTLNVKKSLLKQVPDSYLSKYFSGQLKVEEDGTVSVKRQYAGFKHMIDYLETNRTNNEMATQYEQTLLNTELNYWQIPLRKQSSTELSLVAIFNEAPIKRSYSAQTQSQWELLKPFDLKNYIDSKVINFGSSQINIFKIPMSVLYEGQTEFGKSDGVGRGTGQFGIYEGQYAKGYPHGFGRLIFRTGNFYQGQFLNGTISGQGEYTFFQTKKQISGEWKNGVLKKSAHDELQEGQKIIDNMPPRFISQQEIEQEILIQNATFVTESDFQRIVSSSAFAPYQLLQMESISLQQARDNGLKDIDLSLDIKKIENPEFKYNGQVKLIMNKRRLQQISNETEQNLEVYVGHGLGTSQGLWGIYQGQFKDGVNHGFGKILYSNLNYYVGMFSNGKYEGMGQYFINQNNTMLQGLWKSGVLVFSTDNDENDGFNSQDILIPKSIRIRTKIEGQIEQMFESTPFNETTSEEVLKMWKNIGPIKYSKYITKEQKIQIKKDAGKLYVGQTYVPKVMNVKYGENNFTRVYNSQNYTVSKGYGRIHYPWGLFEGFKDSYPNNSSNSFKGRFIFQNGTVYEGTIQMRNGKIDQNNSIGVGHFNFSDMNIQDSLNQDVRIQEELEIVIIKQFSQKFDENLKLPTNLTQQWKTLKQFDVKQLLSQQIIQIKGQKEEFENLDLAKNKNQTKVQQNSKAGVVSYVDYNKTTCYQGQIDEITMKFEGIGRWANSSEIYEGEFKNGEYHGTGRRIFSDLSIQEGYFLNGNFVASSLQVFDLLEMFNAQNSMIYQNSTLQKQLEEEGPFDLLMYIEDGNITIRPQNLSMYFNETQESRLFAGPMLDLMNQEQLKNLSQDVNQTLQWNGQYTVMLTSNNIGQDTIFGEEKSITGIGKMINQAYQNGTKNHTLIIEGDQQQFARAMYNGDSYIGGFPRDENKVNGTMKFKDGSIMSGQWIDGQFQGRVQFPQELNLQQDWRNPPNEVSQEVLEIWQLQEPLNVQSLIVEEKIDNELFNPYKSIYKEKDLSYYDSCNDNPAVFIGQEKGRTYEECIYFCFQNTKCQAFTISNPTLNQGSECRIYAQDIICSLQKTKNEFSKMSKATMTIVPKYEGNLLNHIIVDNFTYYGMIKDNAAHGIGRATGPWGMYEGNFQKGLPHGYGRIILDANQTYTGVFNKSKVYEKSKEKEFEEVLEYKNNMCSTNAFNLYKGDISITSCKNNFKYYPDAKYFITNKDASVNYLCYIVGSECSQSQYRESMPLYDNWQWFQYPTVVVLYDFSQVPLIGRNMSKIEMYLVEVFQEPIKNDSQGSNHLFDISQLINQKSIKLDLNVSIGWYLGLNSTMNTSKPIDNLTEVSSITWIGQVQDQQISGYGRLQGDWGNYDGHYIDNEIQVQGILTFKNGAWYQGEFVDFTFNGRGKLHLGGKVYDGTWEKNKLKESAISSDVGFILDFNIPRNNQFFRQHVKPV